MPTRHAPAALTREAHAAEPPDLALPGASPGLRELTRRGVRHTYRRGRLLIEEGDVGDTLYIVLSGRLRVFSVRDDGEREITYGTYGPGEYVGEMSLDGGPRSASVETLTATICSVVGRAALQAFVAERPEFAFELLSKVIRRARTATLTARQLALNDVYGRLRLLLEQRAVAAADGTRVVQERLTHLAVAREIGCSREMVSRLMKDLERGGWVVPGPPLVLLKGLPARW